MKTIRIFISSPGDVADEREKARVVIERLCSRYAGRAVIKPVLWEDLPLQADASFQQGIDLVISREHGIDIAVFILWARLGSPTGGLIRREDGREYRSGTEREFDMMLEARRQMQAKGQAPQPAILAYQRRDNDSFQERLKDKETQALHEMIEQRGLAESFIQEEFHDEKGHNLRAYHTYHRPPDFCGRLRVHLHELLDEMLGFDAGEELWEGSPYVGLAAFDFEQERIFRGRDREVCELGEALHAQAAKGCASLLILGPSGSGKSSLARAGLLPALCLHELDDDVVQWRRAVLRPGESVGDLLLALVRGLAADSALGELREEAAAGGLEQLAADLRRDAELTLRQVVLRAFSTADRVAGGGVRLVLLVDQLEELFTDSAITVEERERFFLVLEGLARSGRVSVVMTARSDFYAQLQETEPLRRMKEGAGQYDLLPVSEEALRRIIDEPARLAGLRFDAGVTSTGAGLEERIFADALKHPEALPHLQFLLRELYESRTAQRELTHAAYDALGGVGGVLARRAETVYAESSAEAQAEFDPVFRALVSVKAEELQRAVRRSPSLDLFLKHPRRKVLVDAFVGARLLTTDRDSAGQAVVCVAHEALLRSWPRLAGWIEANRVFFKVRARTEAQAQEWRDAPGAQKSDLLLPPGLRLEEAANLLNHHAADLGETERDFINRSAEAARSRHAAELARLRRRNLVFGSLAVVAIFTALIAAWQWRIGEKEKQRAEAGELSAKSGEIAATAAKAAILRSIKVQIDDIHAMNAKAIPFWKSLDPLLKSYRDSLGIAERLAKQDPANSELQRNLSVAFERVGIVLSAQEQPADALKSYRDSLLIREHLARLEPENPEWQRDLIFPNEQIGSLAQQQKQWPEAAKAYGRVLEIARLCLARSDADVWWMNAFANATGHLWEVLRDAPQGEVEVDRPAALADLRSACAMKRIGQAGSPESPSSQTLPWIEALLSAEENRDKK